MLIRKVLREKGREVKEAYDRLREGAVWGRDRWTSESIGLFTYPSSKATVTISASWSDETIPAHLLDLIQQRVSPALLAYCIGIPLDRAQPTVVKLRAVKRPRGTADEVLAYLGVALHEFAYQRTFALYARPSADPRQEAIRLTALYSPHPEDIELEASHEILTGDNLEKIGLLMTRGSWDPREAKEAMLALRNRPGRQLDTNLASMVIAMNIGLDEEPGPEPSFSDSSFGPWGGGTGFGPIDAPPQPPPVGRAQIEEILADALAEEED